MKFTLYTLTILTALWSFPLSLLAQCDPPPDISAGPDQVLTCTITSLSPFVTTTAPNPTFQWSGPNNFTSIQQNPLLSQPGQYCVTVTSSVDGCTNTDCVNIMSDTVIPGLSISGDTIGCSGPATLIASSDVPGAVFAWSGPGGFVSTQPMVQTSSPGIYTVTVTNSTNGCTNTASFTLIDDPLTPQISNPVVTNVACGGTFSGAISLSATGGVPPYWYTWSNGATTLNLTNLIAGTYCITITDAVGCTEIGCFTVVEPAPLGVQFQPAVPACDGTGSLDITIFNGNSPLTFNWSGPNGFTSTSEDLTNLAPGAYSVTVTDINGCTAAGSVIVPVPTALSLQVITCGTDPLLIVEGAANYTVAWSGVTSGTAMATTNPFTLTGLPAGAYSLTITDPASGCTVQQTFAVPTIPIPCTFVEGRVGVDANSNCQVDAAEVGIPGWYVLAVSPTDTFYSHTDPDGNYTLYVEPGNYSVSLVAFDPLALICTPSVAVSLQQAGSTDTVDFAVQNLDPCPVLTVNLTTPLLRRCFNNNYYYLQYCNNSLTAASDAYIDLTLDPFLTILGAQLPYEDLGNAVYRFQLGTVAGYDCQSIWVNVLVNCDAVLGQTHCSEAHIYPDTLCQPVSPLWSGASVQVRAECETDSLRFILENVGDGDMSTLLEYIVIEDGLMFYESTAPPLGAGDSMVVSLPANGSTWRVEAMQEPFHPSLSRPILSVEGCTNSGSFSTGFVNQYALNEADPWIDIDCTANIGSFDPNDKQGFPTGYGAAHYIRPGTDLEYLIRFQNTGTDTAFTVVVRDTLSAWLDPLTIRPGAASHPYDFKLIGAGLLSFEFENILLPDSNVNEPASHGFIRFHIAPRSNTPLETDIFNRAAIYFDFNEAVMTNTTLHRVGENFILVQSWQPLTPRYAVSIIPNPMDRASWIRVEGLPGQGSYQLRLTDALGRPVRTMNSPEPAFRLERADLPPGIYGFAVEAEGRVVGWGKVLVF